MHESIQELEARLAKDSCNSSRPPSSDSPFKKPPPRSRHQPSGRKPGGQSGRRGITRSLVEAPVQYGPGGSAFAVYMTPYPLQPYQRTAEVLNERAILPVPAVPAPAGASHNPRPATLFGGYASAATRSCASSPTCAFPSTTTMPNVTFAYPSSSRKPLAASVPRRSTGKRGSVSDERRATTPAKA